MWPSKLLQKIPEKEKKAALYNKFTDYIQPEGSKMLKGHANQVDGNKIVSKVTNTLWYLDGRASTIKKPVFYYSDSSIFGGKTKWKQG